MWFPCAVILAVIALQGHHVMQVDCSLNEEVLEDSLQIMAKDIVDVVKESMFGVTGGELGKNDEEDRGNAKVKTDINILTRKDEHSENLGVEGKNTDKFPPAKINSDLNVEEINPTNKDRIKRSDEDSDGSDDDSSESSDKKKKKKKNKDEYYVYGDRKHGFNNEINVPKAGFNSHKSHKKESGSDDSSDSDASNDDSSSKKKTKGYHHYPRYYRRPMRFRFRRDAKDEDSSESKEVDIVMEVEKKTNRDGSFKIEKHDTVDKLGKEHQEGLEDPGLLGRILNKIKDTFNGDPSKSNSGTSEEK